MQIEDAVGCDIIEGMTGRRRFSSTPSNTSLRRSIEPSINRVCFHILTYIEHGVALLDCFKQIAIKH